MSKKQIVLDYDEYLTLLKKVLPVNYKTVEDILNKTFIDTIKNVGYYHPIYKELSNNLDKTLAELRKQLEYQETRNLYG